MDWRDKMVKYRFKLVGDWDYGPGSVHSEDEDLKGDLQARRYAMAITRVFEKKIPQSSYVQIWKYVSGSRKMKYLGDVTSYKPVDGIRTYKFISYEMLSRGIYEHRPLNRDGSFKRITKRTPKTEYGIKGKLKPFGL